MSNTPHRWFHDLAFFWGGAFLANTLPHLLAGVSGSSFQSPFANPPGVGLSSATTNVAWGLINLTLAYLLLVRVGQFDLKRWRHALVFGVGFAFLAFFTAHHFAPFHGGNPLG